MSKIYIKTFLVALLLSATFPAWSQNINLIAGNGFGAPSLGGYSGDGGAATSAELFWPFTVALDTSGNLYIADYANCRIRKVNTSGIIKTFAGTGSPGFSVDGSAATNAQLNNPAGVTVDAAGNVYIGDTFNDRIRKVTTSGIISTIAGNGIQGYSGDGGRAGLAEFYDPHCIAIDTSKNIYITDTYNNCVRKINTLGIISTYAGNGVGGYFGDGGPATAAEFIQPWGLALDPLQNVYISDRDNNLVRVVNTSGIINTFAGNGYGAPYNGGYTGDGGNALSAELWNPTGISFDAAGNFYIADVVNNVIRMINTSGIISTIAGDGYADYYGDGGPATAAELYYPTGVLLDRSGNIYIADATNDRIRIIKSITTGINSSLTTVNEINVYPNPNKGSFIITDVSPGQIAEIYNYEGQKICNEISDKTIIKFDISNFANGIYMIRVLNKYGSVIATKKVLKTE